MSIILENRERRMQVFNLPHEIYCQAAGRCACAEETLTTLTEDPATGERTPRQVTRRIPAALTLLALEKRAGLPEAILRVPEVERAIARQALRVSTERARQVASAARQKSRRQAAHDDAGDAGRGAAAD